MRRPSCTALVALMVAAALLLAGCRPAADEPARAWGTAAEQWLRNVEEAGNEGVPNLARFLEPVVVLDHRGTGGGLALGKDESLALVREVSSSQRDMQLRWPPYLSETGMLVPARWSGRALLTVEDAVLVMRFGAEGLVREESAPSVVSGSSLVARGRDWVSLVRLAQGYAEARAGPGSTTTLEAIPGHGGPAVYAIPLAADAAGFRKVVMLLRSEDQDDCPGRIAVVLTLSWDGAVTGEERYHRVDDARRCLEGPGLFAGWWTRIEVPPAVEHERTGTVGVHGAPVEIWNGTDALASLVSWGLARFSAAGLQAPRPRSVTFYPAADRCQGHIAVAGGPANDEIVVCFGEGLACSTSPCPPWSAKARRTMVHELAHTWITQSLSEDVREEYEERVGLSWADEDEPTDRWALERAAEVMTWGLLGEEEPPPGLDGSPGQLSEEFALLTAYRSPRTG